MNKNYRSITIDEKIDYDNQIISLTCASETPFERQDGKGNSYDEILLVDEANIDMARLKSNCSILLNHNDEKILGQVLDAKIVDRKLVVRVQFRKNDPESVNMFKDVAEGIVKNVSIGYIVNSIEYKKEGNKTIGYVTSWMPFEVSVGVGVPADYTVGFYRSLIAKRKDENMSKNIEELKKKLKELEEEIDAIDSVEEEVVDETDNVEEVVVENDNAETEEVAVEEVAVEEVAVEDKVEDNEEEEIKSIARAFGKEKLVKSALERKISAVEFRKEIKSNITKKEGIIVMERKFDIAKGLKSLVVNGVDASYERQMTEEAYRQAGLNVNANAIVYRTYDGFNATNGAGLLPTSQLSNEFVDVLRTKMAVKNARIISGLQGTISIPAATAASTVAWVEGLASPAAGANPVVGSLTLTPRKLTAYVDVDKNLIVNGSPDPINLVINDLTQQIARKLDYTILKGNASAPAIKGVDGSTGVNAIEFAVASSTWADYLKFAGAVDGYDFNGQPEFVMSATDKAYLKGLSKDTGSGRFVIEDNMLDGYNVNVCGALSTGEIYFGDFSNVIVGNWLSGLEITIDPYSLSISGGYRIVATLIADVAVSNPQGFAKRIDVVEVPESSSEESSGEA